MTYGTGRPSLAFLKEKNFDYKTPAEIYIDSLTQVAKKDGKEELFKDALENLRQLAEKEKEHEFDDSKEMIKEHLKEVILRKLYGEKGFYEGIVLKTHPAVLKAKELLQDQKQYKKLLQG